MISLQAYVICEALKDENGIYLFYMMPMTDHFVPPAKRRKVVNLSKVNNSTPQYITDIMDTTLWHCRFGHHGQQKDRLRKTVPNVDVLHKHIGPNEVQSSTGP